MMCIQGVKNLASLLLIASAVFAQSTNTSWPADTYLTLPGISSLEVNTTAARHTAPGYIFLAPDGAVAGPSGAAGPRIVTERGEDIYIGHGHALSFGVQTYQGKPVLTWWNGTIYPEPQGRGFGYVLIADTSYTVIANVTLPGHFVLDKIGVFYDSNIDVHEIYITPQDTVIVTANNVTNADLSSVGGSKDGWVVEAQFYEIDIKTNEVLYTWKSLDHLDQIPFTASVLPLGTSGNDGSTQDKAWGYFHINSVAPLRNGYIVSSRFLSSVIAVKRSGHVEWRVSGINGADFHLASDAQFSYQHHARVISATQREVIFSIHDNANALNPNPSVPSSGLILKLDLKAKTATKLARFVNPQNLIYVAAQGSFQSLPNGNVLLGHGFVPEIEEYSKDGHILATTQFGVVRKGQGDPLGGVFSYRAFKSEWTACPAQSPRIATKKVNDKKLEVAMSWNGATDIKGWSIYAGSSRENLKKVKEVPKKGFETVTHINRAKYVMAKPKSSCCRGKGKGKDEVPHSAVVTTD